MSLMSQTAETRLIEDKEFQSVLFQLQMNLSSLDRLTDPEHFSMPVDTSGVRKNLESAIEQFRLIQTWAYNECLIGD